MRERALQISIPLSFATIFAMVMILHAAISFKRLAASQPVLLSSDSEARKPISFRALEEKKNEPLNIRTAGSKTSKLKGPPSFRKFAPRLNNELTRKLKKQIALSDLSAPKAAPQVKRQLLQRPGTRPLIAQEKVRALPAISLKGKEITEFMKGSSSAAISGDPRASKLAKTDILVNLEVPEGVEPDELNKYELMFYGFQRRTAINYVNAFYKNLDKFQRENPHLNFPMTDGKQIMTGRLTYDDKGNIKQIKMIRWSNEERLQGFFEKVLKEMDVLQNPPQALWKNNGEFSIFFSFVVNG